MYTCNGGHWMEKLRLEDFVHISLTKETFVKVYEHHMQPVNGQNLWLPIKGDEISHPYQKEEGQAKKTQKEGPS